MKTGKKDSMALSKCLKILLPAPAQKPVCSQVVSVKSGAVIDIAACEVQRHVYIIILVQVLTFSRANTLSPISTCNGLQQMSCWADVNSWSHVVIVFTLQFFLHIKQPRYYFIRFRGAAQRITLPSGTTRLAGCPYFQSS